MIEPSDATLVGKNTREKTGKSRNSIGRCEIFYSVEIIDIS